MAALTLQADGGFTEAPRRRVTLAYSGAGMSADRDLTAPLVEDGCERLVDVRSSRPQPSLRDGWATRPECAAKSGQRVGCVC